MAGVDQFLENLRKSRLLTPEQWQIVRRLAAGAPVESKADGAAAGSRAVRVAPTAAELARQLADLGLITAWQAEKLLEGKRTFILAKYKLLDCIGTGGMGAVFKAVHSDMGRVVAVKLLYADVMKNRQAVARFRQEIQAVAALDDEHIVAAYDAGFTGGVHYLVMEYVEGHDLGYILNQNGPLPVAWACECIRQAALGLQHAHKQGMVHRDIKPTNLLVARQPESDRPLVKILDLGLARFVSETVSTEAPLPGRRGSDGSLTQIGQFLGTPDYIAPEQARDTRRADIRSDIFSLGCTLYRLLTGQLPFPGETVVQKLAAREESVAARVSSLRSDVPAGLDAVVARMLAHDPADRFQTPLEVAQALAPFAGRVNVLPASAAEPAASRQRPLLSPEEDTRLEAFFKSLASEETGPVLSASHLAGRLKRISPRVWLGSASAVLVALLGFYLWSWLTTPVLVLEWPLEEREGAVLAVNQQYVKLPGQKTVRVSGRPGTWDLRLEREGFEPIETTVALGRGERLDFTPEWRPTPRTLRWRRLQKLQERAAAAAGLDVLSPQAKAVRSDLLSFLREFPTTRAGKAAVGVASGLPWPLDLLVSTNAAEVEFQEFVSPGTSAPKEALVGLFGDSRLKSWNIVTAVAIGGDGALLAVASRDGTVQVFDLPDGRRRHVIVPPEIPEELAFNPCAPMLAVAGTSESVTLWNAADGTLAATLPDAAGPVAFSRDGRLLATRAARQEIALWDAGDGQLQRTLQGHAAGVLRNVVFSHDGKMLASSGTESSVLLWDTASGQERRRFAAAHSPLFSPDDAFLAAGAQNGDLLLWDTRTGESRRTLDEGGDPLAFDRDGTMLVSKRLGRAILWNLATGEEIRTVVEVPELAALSPDGTWLAGGDETFGELRLWNLSAGAARRDLATTGPVAALAFAADSATVVVGTRDHVVQVFDAASGTERIPTGFSPGPADLSSDGQFLAVQRGNHVELIDVTTGTTTRTFAGDAAGLESLVFSPDGRLVAGFGGWGFFKTSLRLWEAADGRELSLTGGPTGTVRTMAFSADGQLLACAGDSRLVTIWNLSRQAVQQTLDDFPDRVTALAFSPDGRRLAAACFDRTLALWDLKTGTRKSLPASDAACRELVFSRDGRLLAATAGTRVLVWNGENGKEPADLAVSGTSGSIAFDPAGQTLIAAADTGEIRLWSEPGRERYRDEPDRVIRIGPRHGVIRRILFSPDGRHILSVNGNGTIYVLRLSGPR